jgi:putative ABC transport system ATP-binding protein
MLELIDLARPGLQPVNLRVAKGECVAVRGPSGAGKTLFLRAIADLDPNTGRVMLEGRERESMPASRWRRQVAYVPAEPGWWADTVGEHFSDWDAAAPMVEALRLPADARTWPLMRCSTGERQRLALARALLLRPRVLLLDEPTSGLDGEAVEVVESMVRIRLIDGMAAIWVTHQDAQAARVARRTVFVEAGRVVDGAVIS